MRRVITIVAALLAGVCPFAAAQQAGENINVLPVVLPDQAPDDWFLIGDGYLQRQVEPTIAASTRNPDHLLAFFNDYRAVDIDDDIGLGETESLAVLFNTARTVLMASLWLDLPRIHVMPTAAAEAWVGMSRSYDGGLTWSGAFLPGAPFDTSTTSTTSPVWGLQAATDPVVAPGPCGKFYVVFMAFTRGQESKLVVARYQDLNNVEGGDSIVYQGMTVIESGNNATHGYFLDKPDIEVDVAREPGAALCADRVYVSYSTFNGLDKDGKFQSKVSFARSFDGGLTFSTQKLNPPYNQNQGSALAVDPSDGTVYMIWRHFWAPDAILMVRSTDAGQKWSKPVVVTGDIVPMQAFDQPTISTDIAPEPPTSYPNPPYPDPTNPGFPETAFRSNGFPTATVTDDGTIFAAWQERVDINPDSPGFREPLSGGSPRIVAVRSTDGGATWTDVDGRRGYRLAVDIADRDSGGDLPEPGFGALPQPRPSGPQVMPKLSFGGGRLMLAYYESRGRIANYGTDAEVILPEAGVSPYTGFISGYDRLLDLRAALLDPATGDLLNEGSTTQVSRYPIRAGAVLDPNDPYSEDLSDVAAVNSPCSPDSGAFDPDTFEPYPQCVRQVNRANAPQSAAGTSPFIGDYVDLAPSVQFIYDAMTGRWRWATAADDVPSRSFHSVFADNRHLTPPPGPNEWTGFSFYDAPYEEYPNNEPGCVNPGSRNTDVLTSRIDAGLVLSAPTTFKQLQSQRGFPISIKNTTGETRSYLVEIVAGFESASFHRTLPDVDSGEIQLFPYSGTALVVYVETTAVPPVKVRVTELPPCAAAECATGTITLNLDPTNPIVDAIDGSEDAQYPTIEAPFVINPFVINDGAAAPFVINPFVINPFVINPFVINPFVINPFVINPFVINPFVINSTIEDVIDTTWTVDAGTSNTASSYLPLINIDNAQAYLDAGYVFQLIAYKGSLYGNLDGCRSVNVAQPQILANVTQDPGAANPFVINPFVINPFVINPFVINPFVINSTFTMAPDDDPTLGNDGTTKAPPPSNEVKITLRAFKTVPTNLKEGGTESIIYDPTVDPPSLVVVPLPCDPDNPVHCDVASNAPDLVPEGVDPTPVEAAAGGTLAGFPAGGWTLWNRGTGDATAENGFLNHGFHVCPNDHIDNPPELPGHPGEWRWDLVPLDLSACTGIDQSLPHALALPPNVWCVEGGDDNPSECSSLAAESPEEFPSIDLSIPVVAPGDYYVVLYVDDTLEVSERNEVNNWVAVPLEITNPPPVADDLSLTTPEDTAISGTLTASDAGGDEITFAILTDPAHGIIEPFDPSSGHFTYTPDADFNGTDSFTFVANDGLNDSNIATVTITVEAVNDAPTASDATFETEQNTPVSGTLSGSDIDAGDVLTFTITAGPTFGTVVVDDATTGAFTYSPNAGFAGQDTFTYEVADIAGATATGTITVNVIDTTPDWLFIGYDNPWTPGYTVTAGSSIPLKWRYADPVTGALVNSSAGGTEVRITGWPETGCYSNGSTIYVVEDSGSSDLRYVNGSWQINWDTVGLPVGCYEVAVYHPTTHQLDTHNSLGQPLTVVLR